MRPLEPIEERESQKKSARVCEKAYWAWLAAGRGRAGACSSRGGGGRWRAWPGRSRGGGRRARAGAREAEAEAFWRWRRPVQKGPRRPARALVSNNIVDHINN